MGLPDGRVLWHKVDPAEGREGQDWHQVELHATDAAHALETDGKDGYHWRLEKPADEPVVEEGVAAIPDDGTPSPIQGTDPNVEGAGEHHEESGE